MNKQRAAQLYELADRLSKLDVNTLSEEQRQQRSAMIAKLKEEVQGVSEASPRVDSLVTDSLKLMQGPELADAVQALKTVLGDREFSSRRGHYNFFIRQMMDMYGQRGVTETKKPSPKLTPVEMKKTDPVSEEINTEAYERLQKVFAFKNYES